jgi:hypothetical protein
MLINHRPVLLNRLVFSWPILYIFKARTTMLNTTQTTIKKNCIKCSYQSRCPVAVKTSSYCAKFPVPVQNHDHPRLYLDQRVVNGLFLTAVN